MWCRPTCPDPPRCRAGAPINAASRLKGPVLKGPPPPPPSRPPPLLLLLLMPGGLRLIPPPASQPRGKRKIESCSGGQEEDRKKEETRGGVRGMAVPESQRHSVRSSTQASSNSEPLPRMFPVPPPTTTKKPRPPFSGLSPSGGPVRGASTRQAEWPWRANDPLGAGTTSRSQVFKKQARGQTNGGGAGGAKKGAKK